MAITIDGAGTITGLDADGISAQPVFPGNVLQVVSAEDSSGVSTTSTTFIDTNLVATITPSSASSKILVLVQCSLRQNTSTNNGSYAEAKVFRESVAVGQAVNTGTREPVAPPDTTHSQGGGAIMLFDSPATTSLVTYRLRIRATSSVITAILNIGQGTAADPGSTITLLEIAG